LRLSATMRMPIPRSFRALPSSFGLWPYNGGLQGSEVHLPLRPLQKAM
jgi:hypothetical protein